MELTALLSLASSLPALLGGVGSKIAHDSYANKISDLKLDMPSGLTEAEQILRKSTADGLPGYETMKGDIMGSLPQTLEALKEVAGNPAYLLGALNDAQGDVTSQLSDLAIKDAVAKMQNNAALTNFLSTAKAGFQVEQNKYRNDVLAGVEKEKLLGWKELFGGLSSGASTGISSYGNLSALQAYKDMYSPWADFMKSANSGAAPAMGSPVQMKDIFSPETPTKSLKDIILSA